MCFVYSMIVVLVYALGFIVGYTKKKCEDKMICDYITSIGIYIAAMNKDNYEKIKPKLNGVINDMIRYRKTRN